MHPEWNMQRQRYARPLAVVACLLATVTTAVADTPSFFQQWAYPWGPWTPDTPHLWGVYPPYEKRPWAYGPQGTFRETYRRRGFVEVHMPDDRGLLYVNGDPTPLRGRDQVLHTEILKADCVQRFELRAAFRSGDHLLIEDRTVTIHRGEVVSVTFDGNSAIQVNLPAPAPAREELPLPRHLPPSDSER
jgi:hypothetical protein